jgi:hypothetical protein
MHLALCGGAQRHKEPKSCHRLEEQAHDLAATNFANDLAEKIAMKVFEILIFAICGS